MKLTRQIQIAVGTLAFVAVGAGVIEWIEVSNSNLQGSVINKSGIVRGATQRLVKLETNGKPSDSLINNMDVHLEGLISGSEELRLPPAVEGSDYQQKIKAVEAAWQDLKNTIYQYRKDPSLQSKLIADSEAYFELTNEAVFAAEERSLEIVAEEQWTIALALIAQLTGISIVFILLLRATKLLRSSVASVAGSSTQIAATVEEQGRIVSEQTASVNETTTTVEELGASSLQAAQQANSSAAGAQQAFDLSENGKKTVQETLKGIADLRSKVGDIAEQIMRLSEQTEQISSVSGLVADVADQTNMLALNAAVEAARAGEQGKGFAVVAGEIRKLADQSRSSANKINTLVADIQASINSTVMVTDEGTKTASAGIKLAEGTLTVFQEIADAVNEVSLNSQQIALSAKQQAVGVQQAVSAMNAINLGAKETATVVTQVQASTEELTDIAHRLEVTV